MPTTKMTGLDIHRVIVSDIGMQRIEIHLKKGDLDAALDDARSPAHRMNAEQIIKAALKGVKHLLENNRENEAVKAAVAFKLTDQQLNSISMPEKLRGEVFAALVPKQVDMRTDLSG